MPTSESARMSSKLSGVGTARATAGETPEIVIVIVIVIVIGIVIVIVIVIVIIMIRRKLSTIVGWPNEWPGGDGHLSLRRI